ncbi:unnamed protein product [Gordionus sp. m RMFG-2023]
MIFFCILILFVCYKPINGYVKCYSCGTFPTSGALEKLYGGPPAQAACPEPFEKKIGVGESICNGFCRKTVYRTDKKYYTARGCSPLCYAQEEGDVMKTFCCNTDHCNVAGAHRPFIILYIVLISFLVFIL